MKLAFIPKKEFMQEALSLAREASALGEVPVGAVVVKDGKIVGRGRNRMEANASPLCHAEMEAIHNACALLGERRLTGCDLYVTLEPCPMCTGAIINAHINRLVYGLDDLRAGCCGTAANLFDLPYSHRPEIYRGYYEEECRELLQAFFRRLRKRQ